MAKVKSKLKIKVKGKLKERDPDTGEVLREFEIPENVVDDPELIEEFLGSRGGNNGSD
jgi:hypothetical protein